MAGLKASLSVAAFDSPLGGTLLGCCCLFFCRSKAFEAFVCPPVPWGGANKGNQTVLSIVFCVVVVLARGRHLLASAGLIHLLLLMLMLLLLNCGCGYLVALAARGRYSGSGMRAAAPGLGVCVDFGAKG